MDFVQNLPVFIIMALVLIGLPILLGKLSGKSPMEVFFGERVNQTIFGKKNDAGSESADAPASGSSTASGKGTGSDKDTASGKGTASGKSAGKKGKGKDTPDRNSTKQELISFISDLVSYGRRNHFCSLVPGTLTLGGEVTSFAAIIVTRRALLCFNCFGFGGQIYCENGKETWRQVMNGTEKTFESPVLKNERQEKILEQILTDCGYEGTAVQIFGVFTAPSASLQHRSGTNCYTVKDMMSVLQGTDFLKDKGVDPKKVAKALEKYSMKA